MAPATVSDALQRVHRTFAHQCVKRVWEEGVADVNSLLEVAGVFCAPRAPTFGIVRDTCPDQDEPMSRWKAAATIGASPLTRTREPEAHFAVELKVSLWSARSMPTPRGSTSACLVAEFAAEGVDPGRPDQIVAIGAAGGRAQRARNSPGTLGTTTAELGSGRKTDHCRHHLSAARA